MEESERSYLLYVWTVIFTLASTLAVALYIYFKSKFSYWKRRGFPEFPETPLPLVGHTLKLLIGQKNFTEMFAYWCKAAGDVPYVGLYQGNEPCLLIKDPEYAKYILIKDFHAFTDRAFEVPEEADPLNGKSLFSLKGQRWKDMRARLSPTFTSGRMKAMLPLMQGCTAEFLQFVTTKIEANGGEAILDFKECSSCFTIDVIATCAFGIHCDALQNPETSEFRRMGKIIVKPTLKRSIVMAALLICPNLLKKFRISFTDDETNVFFRNFVKDMISKREAEIDGRKGKVKGYGDFIHHLVMLKKRGLRLNELKDDDDDENDENEYGTPGNDQDKVEPTWENLSLDDLTAQVLLFFSAGFETTSALLSFALYELSCSEEGKRIQQKLRKEVDKVMEEDGGKITYDGLKRMTFLDRILNESLRLYPPAGILSRVTTQAYRIPGTNLTLDKGTQVFIAAEAMQNDEKFFPNPKRFDPDRFLPENKEKWNQFSFLPFGEGPRMCIGQRFAQMQARMGLAALISKFEFDLCQDKTSVPLTFKKRSFVLAAETGIWLKVRMRGERK